MTVTVAATCTACGACIATCPERALLPAPRRPAVIDVLCTDCLACLEVCPVDAIVPVPPGAPRSPGAPVVHPIEEASYRILEQRVDLSGWAPKYFPQELVQQANSLLSDRVLFGTDWPVIEIDQWLEGFAALPFKDEVRPKILLHNAVRLLGLELPPAETATEAARVAGGASAG